MPNIIKKKPARLMSEQEVLKRLGIPDFRHLSKSTAIEFISSIPQMDKDVALKALDQFPELANVALGLAKEEKETLLAAFKANDESSKAALAVINAIIEVLTKQLEKDEASSEEKMQIVDSFIKLAEESRKINKDNQNFILKSLAIFATTVGAVFLGTVAVLGANGRAQLPDLSDSSDEENPYDV